MKSLLPRRLALSAALGVILFLVSNARAQNADSVRVVRLSRADGQVLVSHPGNNAWEEASANVPLQEGDTLATQSGYAEIEFENGATAYLAENSVLQFTQLGFSAAGRETELTLSQGAGNFYANLTSQDSFIVHTLTFDVAIPERAQFRVDGFRDGAAVEVLVGSVTLSTTKGSTSLEKGQSVAIHQNDFNDFSIGSLPTAEDDFDQWVTQEGEIIRSGNKNTLGYISSPNQYGLSDLSLYGSWVNLSLYGLSWRPFRVGLSWTPYLNGRWILDPRLGWIWVSGEPWGWTPYHFGSWLLSPVLGWVWVPGGPSGLVQWEAARVNWVQVGNQVGWVAKSPNDREGAPANAKQGVVTRSLQSSRDGNESNELVTGKGLQNVALLKQPPLEFAANFGPGAPGATRPGVKSTIGIAPRSQSNNSSIVLDSKTHTFINRDAGGDAGVMNNPPVKPAGLMPPPAARTEIPPATVPPAGLMNSRTNRALLPPSNHTVPAPRVNVPASLPASRALPVRPSVSAPNLPHPAAPPASPRPAGPPQASAPHPAQNQPGSATHAGTPAQPH